MHFGAERTQARAHPSSGHGEAAAAAAASRAWAARGLFSAAARTRARVATRHPDHHRVFLRRRSSCPLSALPPRLHPRHAWAGCPGLGLPTPFEAGLSRCKPGGQPTATTLGPTTCSGAGLRVAAGPGVWPAGRPQPAPPTAPGSAPREIGGLDSRGIASRDGSGAEAGWQVRGQDPRRRRRLGAGAGEWQHGPAPRLLPSYACVPLGVRPRLPGRPNLRQAHLSHSAVPSASYAGCVACGQNHRSEPATCDPGRLVRGMGWLWVWAARLRCAGTPPWRDGTPGPLLAQLTLWLVARAIPWRQASTVLCGIWRAAWGSGGRIWSRGSGAGKWGVSPASRTSGCVGGCAGGAVSTWHDQGHTTHPQTRPAARRPRARLLHARCSWLRAALRPLGLAARYQGHSGWGAVTLSCGGLMAVGSVRTARAPGRRRASPSGSSAGRAESQRPRSQAGQASSTSPTPSTGPWPVRCPCGRTARHHARSLSVHQAWRLWERHQRASRHSTRHAPCAGCGVAEASTPHGCCVP